MTALLNEKTLPVAIIVIDVAAAIAYAFQKDIRHTIYWLSAAVLTSAVTF